MDTPPETSDDLPEKRLPTVRPIVEINTAKLGPLTFRSASLKDAMEVEKLDSNNALTPEAFATSLMRVVGRRVGKTADVEAPPALTEEDILSLEPEERAKIVKELLEGMPHLYSDSTTERETAEDGSIVLHHAGYKVSLSRQDGESDEAYLLRTWKDFWRRQSETISNVMKSLTSATDGLSAVWKKNVIPDLFTNKIASLGLSDQITRMGLSNKGLFGGLGISDPFEKARQQFAGLGKLGRNPATDLVADKSPLSLVGQASVVDSPFTLPKIPPPPPPNPIHETNDLLESWAAT